MVTTPVATRGPLVDSRRATARDRATRASSARTAGSFFFRSTNSGVATNSDE